MHGCAGGAIFFLQPSEMRGVSGSPVEPLTPFYCIFRPGRSVCCCVAEAIALRPGGLLDPFGSTSPRLLAMRLT
jgi:hypothetical protein